MKIIYGAVIALFCLVSLIEATKFQKCRNRPSPLSVVVKECDIPPCNMYRGTNITAEFAFKILSDTESLRIHVRSVVFGVSVDYPMPSANACRRLKEVSGCPLKQDQIVTYLLEMPILKSYPKIPMNIEFTFFDDDDVEQVCFSVRAKVVDRGDKLMLIEV